MSRRTADKNAFVTNWNPYMTYTLSRQIINQWIDIYGSWAFYNGSMYKIVATKIFGGRYEVKFVVVDK